VNILNTLLRLYKSRVRGVCENVGMFRSEMLVQVLCVENAGELAASVLAIRSEIPIQLFKTGKLGVAGRSLPTDRQLAHAITL